MSKAVLNLIVSGWGRPCFSAEAAIFFLLGQNYTIIRAEKDRSTGHILFGIRVFNINNTKDGTENRDADNKGMGTVLDSMDRVSGNNKAGAASDNNKEPVRHRAQIQLIKDRTRGKPP